MNRSLVRQGQIQKENRHHTAGITARGCAWDIATRPTRPRPSLAAASPPFTGSPSSGFLFQLGSMWVPGHLNQTHEKQNGCKPSLSSVSCAERDREPGHRGPSMPSPRHPQSPSMALMFTPSAVTAGCSDPPSCGSPAPWRSSVRMWSQRLHGDTDEHGSQGVCLSWLFITEHYQLNIWLLVG